MSIQWKEFKTYFESNDEKVYIVKPG